MSSLATTYLNPVIEFQMRVFRFRDPTEPAHTKQEHDIVCEIYLEEAESTYEEKQCECYTPDECKDKSPPVEVTQPSSTKTTSTTTTKTTPATTTKTTPITTRTTTTRTTSLTTPVTTTSNKAPTTSTTLSTTTPKQTHTLKLTGSVATNYEFKDDLNNPESALFKNYASKVESDMSWIFNGAAMIKSVQVTVTGFKPVQSTRKRRQAMEGNALAEFEALAEIPKNVEFEDVETDVEKEIQSISWEWFEHLDASSFRYSPYNKIDFVFPTTQAITTASTPVTASPTAASSTTAPPVGSWANHTPYSLNLRIEYKPNDAYTWGTNIFLERKCMGTLIANNVIITSSACCEDIQDFTIINSSGGTNGMINTNARYGGLGAHTAHLSMSFFGSSFVCKNGQKKNGKCKKAGKRRKREDGDEKGDEDGDVAEMICILRTTFNVVEQFEKKPIKDRFKEYFK